MRQIRIALQGPAFALWLAGLAAWSFSGVSLAQETSNFELRAVPAPGEVAIDGRLDEWDTSARILMCHDVASLLESHSAVVSAMYDAKGLYLAIDKQDSTPMNSAWDPVSQPMQGWRGDNAQIYFWDDPTVPHDKEGSLAQQLTVWWHGDSRKAGATMLRGRGWGEAENYEKLPGLEGKGVEQAYRVNEDGRGYVLEMRIDWDLLSRSRKAYGPGESMGMGLEVFWDDGTGKAGAHRLTDLINRDNPQRRFFWKNPDAWGRLVFLAKGDVAPSPTMRLLDVAAEWERKQYDTVGPVAIAYELPADGFATLVVEKKDGARVRNLISDYPRRKGRNVDYWDGRDDEGRLVAPGEYRVRGLFHEALDVTYEFHFGSPSAVSWPTADGRGGWLSNHVNHFGILADAERVYVSALTCEGPYPLIALNENGDKVWGGLARWHAGPLARCGDYLYTVNEHSIYAKWSGKRGDQLDEPSDMELIRLDPETGREVPFPDGQSKHKIASWNLYRDGATRKWDGWTAEHKAHDADWLGVNPQGLAALDGTLFVALHFDDKLLKVDAESGKATGEIPLERPAGLAGDGRRLLAVSGKRVVEVDVDSGAQKPVISEGLAAPVGLAVDASGRIYVSDWADRMCVKVFQPDGAFVKSIGKPGGRAWTGPYDPSGMMQPLGISVDAKGRLWVAESYSSPRRVSCWDTGSGGLILERLGRAFYGGEGYYVLPDQPDRAIVINNLVDLDWDQGRWRVASTLWDAARADQLLGFSRFSRFGRVLHHRGKRLIVHTSMHWWRGTPMISELTEDGRALPLCAVGSTVEAIPHLWQDRRNGCDPPPVFADHLYTDPRMQTAAREVVPWFFTGPLAGDTRAVGGPQNRMEIIRRSGIKGSPKSGGRPNANFLWNDLDGDGGIDDDEITYHATPGLEGPLPAAWSCDQWSGGVVDDELTFYMTAIQDGVAHHFRLPVARWTDAGAPVYEMDRAERIVDSPYMGEAAWLSADGNLLTYANIPGLTRPNRERDPLVMFRPDGSIAWTFPSPWTGVHGSHTAPKSKRGQLVGPLGVCGEATLDGVGEVFMFHTNQGTGEFFTADGLYIGRLFKDARAAPEPWPEQPRRGMSINDVTNGGEWFGGQFFQRPDGKMFVVCSRNAGVIGEVKGLETTRRLEAQTIAFGAEQYREAQALVARDTSEEEAVLKIAALKKPVRGLPKTNAFSWRPRRAARWRYDSGRAAEATWTYDDKSLYVAFKVEDDTPMVNSGEDIRRLFKFGDAAILELRTNPEETSKQAAPGDVRLLFSVHQGKPVAVLYDYRRKGKEAPVEFASVTTTRIDRLEVLERATVEFERKADGYTLRAAVPLEDLRWAPKAGGVYPGDFGVVYSDKSGQTNELRLYWSNKATGIVSDLSLEANIQPADWGRFELE